MGSGTKFWFFGRRAVAYRDAVDVVLFDELFELGFALFYLLLRRRGINDGVRQEVPVAVDDRYLAARAVRGVEPRMALERLYRLLGRAVEQLVAHLALYRRTYEPVVAVLYRAVDKRVECRMLLLRRGNYPERSGAVDVHAHLVTAALFAARHREHAVAGHVGDGLVELEIRLVYLFLFRVLAALVGRSRQMPRRQRLLAQALADGSVVAYALGDYVARAVDRGFGVGHLVFCVYVRRGEFGFVVGIELLRLDDIGERLEPARYRDGRARLFLLLVRAVHVLRLGERFGIVERDAYLVRPFALRLD